MGIMKSFLRTDRYSRGQHVSPGTSVSVGNSSNVEVIGFNEAGERLGELMTSDPYMANEVKKFIRKSLKEARKNLSKDAANYLKSDPRKAARAVKYAVYKSVFGGNVSVLQKGRGTAGAKYQLIRKRKLDMNPHQRGGNRRPRVDDERNRLETYFGADRGFVLRFINSGTVNRQTRYGNRGAISQRDWFGHTAPWQIETAAEKVAYEINEYVKRKANG